MSYKFGIINYADQDVPGLVSDHLIEENRDQLAELLHLNSDGFIPIYLEDEEPQPKKDQRLLRKSGINKIYDNLIYIVANGNNLIRKSGRDNNDVNNNWIKESVASTNLDTSDKITDNLEHCLWILITAKQGKNQLSSLLHLPAIQLTKSHIVNQIINPLLLSYKEKISSEKMILGDVFIGGGSLAINKEANQKIRDDYIDGVKNAKVQIKNIFNQEPIIITGPKGQGKECVIIETQKQRVHILRPRDDLTMSNQIL